MLGKTKGFLSYLWGIPSYIWYVCGERVVKTLFPKSFQIWFRDDIKGIEDIYQYLQDKEVAIHRQLEENRQKDLNWIKENKKKTQKKVKKNGPTKKHKK